MAKLNLKPTPGYILIEQVEPETKTASGIYLAETSSEKPQKGKVLAAGAPIYQEGREILSPAKTDQIVYYKKWGGNEVKINGKEYLFVKFEDIMAIES